MSSFVIRPIEEDDLSAIADMIAKLADHVRPGFVPLADVENLKQYGPFGTKMFQALIAIRDEKPVGCCLYSYMFSGWRGKPGLFIQDLFVEQSERGNGLGKSLLQALIDRESENDCSFIQLEVEKNNKSGQGFYQKLGFRKHDSDDMMVIEIAAFRL